MKFRTAVKPLHNVTKLGYTDRILLIGSCFSSNIGAKLLQRKFYAKVNPLGIVYDPVSIAFHLDLLSGSSTIDHERVVSYDGMYYHLDFHSDIKAKSKEKLIDFMEQRIASYQAIIKQSTHCFITLGTAIIHDYQGHVVCNCHKQPADIFDKKILSFQQVAKALMDCTNSLKSLQPSIGVTFTLSPVRHSKDGLLQNQSSKSILRAVLAELQYPYFPAYELMIDDLRDYRFYKKDLIHPNDMAIDYIWEYFKNNLLSQDALLVLRDVESIVNRLSHRPMNPDSDKHKAFLEKLEEDINLIKPMLPDGAFD